MANINFSIVLIVVVAIVVVGVAGWVAWHGRGGRGDDEFTIASERVFVLETQRRRRGISDAQQAELNALKQRLESLRAAKQTK